MALPQAYAQYNNSKIMTAAPSELTLMLYDGSIKFCNIAKDSIERGNLEKAHMNIVKAQRIIDYLRQTLDMKYEVAKDFENIYVYISRRLIEANMHKDPEILDEILTHMRSVRDNWKEVMKANGVKSSMLI